MKNKRLIIGSSSTGKTLACLPLLTRNVRQKEAIMKRLIVALLVSVAFPSLANDPACNGVNNWAAMMAFAQLKNAGITNNDNINFGLTRVKRIASEKIGDDLYRQVHLVTYIEKTGREIEVITTNDASNEECSMSDVQIYVVEKKLDG